MLRNTRRAGPRQKKDIQSIQSKIRRFGIKQQKLHRERVIYLMMDVPLPHERPPLEGSRYLNGVPKNSKGGV